MRALSALPFAAIRLIRAAFVRERRMNGNLLHARPATSSLCAVASSAYAAHTAIT